MNENGMMNAAVPLVDPLPNYDYKEDFSKVSKNQLFKRWSLIIEHCDVGCVVKIGCKAVAFSNIEEALPEIELYYKDPHASIEKWRRLLNI